MVGQVHAICGKNHAGKGADIESLNKTRFSPDPNEKLTTPRDEIEIQDSNKDQDSRTAKKVVEAIALIIKCKATECEAKLAVAKANQASHMSVTPNLNANNKNNNDTSANFDDKSAKTSAIQRLKKTKAIFQLLGASIGANKDGEKVACLGDISVEMENFLNGNLKSTKISHFNSMCEQTEKEHQDSRDYPLRGTKMPQFGKATMVALCHGNF